MIGSNHIKTVREALQPQDGDYEEAVHVIRERAGRRRPYQVRRAMERELAYLRARFRADFREELGHESA